MKSEDEDSAGKVTSDGLRKRVGDYKARLTRQIRRRRPSPFAIHDRRPHAHPLAPASGQRETPVWFELADDSLERRLDEYIARDPYPLPATADREGYFLERHLDYWLSGLSDYLSIRRAVERHGGRLAAGSGVLDLGCASGRVVRHFLAQAEDLDLWACDINSRHVEWIRKHLRNASIKPFQNNVLPTLPIPDAALSVVCAFSVFTHIDEFELGWIAELRRMLEPGGIAYLTIHSEHTWSGLNPDWSLWEGLVERRHRIVNQTVTPELFDSPMPQERVVFEWLARGNYNCNVFHHTDYIRDAWGRFFDVVEIIQRGSDYQDVVVMQRK